jgi:hypothetical protein
MIHLYEYWMAQTLITIVLLMVVMTSVSGSSGFTVVIPQAVAQTNSAENMTTPMLESARFHLKAADRLLLDGDRTAALRQINLAEIQLALLNMASQGASMNSAQAIEFITGGSLSSSRMGASCVIDNQAMVSCMR